MLCSFDLVWNQAVFWPCFSSYFHSKKFGILSGYYLDIMGILETDFSVRQACACVTTSKRQQQLLMTWQHYKPLIFLDFYRNAHCRVAHNLQHKMLRFMLKQETFTGVLTRKARWILHILFWLKCIVAWNHYKVWIPLLIKPTVIALLYPHQKPPINLTNTPYMPTFYLQLNTLKMASESVRKMKPEHQHCASSRKASAKLFPPRVYPQFITIKPQ